MTEPGFSLSAPERSDTQRAPEEPAPPWSRSFFRGDNLAVMRAWRGEAGFNGETYLFFSEGNLRWLARNGEPSPEAIVNFLTRCLPPKVSGDFLNLYDWEAAVARFRGWDGQPPSVVPFPVARILRDTELYCFRLFRSGEKDLSDLARP